MRKLAGIALCCLSLSLNACLAPQALDNYDGDPRPDSEVATLEQHNETNLHIFHVDGKSPLNRITTFNPDNWHELRLLPGDHTLDGGLYQGRRYALFNKTFTFEAGKRYRMAYDTVDDAKVKFYLVEVK